MIVSSERGLWDGRKRMISQEKSFVSMYVDEKHVDHVLSHVIGMILSSCLALFLSPCHPGYVVIMDVRQDVNST